MKRIILSRTDSIGDVILSLPMAGYIRQKFPDAQIYFIGKTYTEPIIKQCGHIDHFINWDELQKSIKPVDFLAQLNADAIIHIFPNKKLAKWTYKARIGLRIGTLGRWAHLLYCNKRIYFTRKNSPLHEAQLNLKLLKPLGISSQQTLQDIAKHSGWQKPSKKDNPWIKLLDSSKKNIILHPKSQGSAIEWGLDNFSKLIKILPLDKFNIFITGTAAEAQLIGKNLPFKQKNVHNLLGKMTLSQLIAFITEADAIVAASTGPLHIGAIAGIQAIGLFSSRRPIHPGRWQPIGPKAQAVVFDPNCIKCAKGQECTCIHNITPLSISHLLK